MSNLWRKFHEHKKRTTPTKPRAVVFTFEGVEAKGFGAGPFVMDEPEPAKKAERAHAYLESTDVFRTTVRLCDFEPASLVRENLERGEAKLVSIETSHPELSCEVCMRIAVEALA